jgi:hypothetical protein
LADAGRRGTSVWSLTDRSAPVFAVEREGTTADLAWSPDGSRLVTVGK